MNKDTIGLKITNSDLMAKSIAIIRKYDNCSVSIIKTRIQHGEYVLVSSYTDRFGLKKVIHCYEDLADAGISAEIFELDDEPTTIEFLRNLDRTYDEVSDEIDSEE